MKQGETVRMKLPPRVYGELENVDIMFTGFHGHGKRVIKQIIIR